MFDLSANRRGATASSYLTVLLLALASATASNGPRYLRIIAVPSLSQAETVAADFRSGKPFEVLAREHSVDPSARRGGYLGFVPLDRLNSQFKQEAADLEPGQISEPFQSGADWVILYRMRRDFLERVASLQAEADRLLAQEDSQGALKALQDAVLLYPDYAQGYFSLGVVYGRLKQPEREKESYRQAIRLAPDFAEAHYNLAKVYSSEGNPYSAMQAFQKTIEVKPDHAEAYVNLGALQLALGNQAAALEAARRAVEINPLLAAAHYNLGLAQASSDLESALASFRLAATLDPSQLEARINGAVALARLGRFQEARGEVDKLLTQHPDFEPAQQLLRQLESLPSQEGPPGAARRAPADPAATSPGTAEVETQAVRAMTAGDYARAVVLAEAALRTTPDSTSLRRLAAQARTGLGSLLFSQGRFKTAAGQWRQALVWLPDFQPALLGLARTATRQGAFAEAERLIDKAARQDSHHPAVLLAKARLEYERRNFRTAYDILSRLEPSNLQPPQLLDLLSGLLDLDLREEALEIAGNTDLDPEQQLNLSHLLTENSLYTEAEALLAGKDSAPARLQLANLYLRQLRFTEAEPLLLGLLQENYRPWQTGMLLGKLYVDSGHADQATSVLAEAVQQQPSNVNGIHQLALACHQAGKLDEAVNWLRRGLEIEPQSDRLLYELGKILVERGDAAEALPLLLQVVSSQPDHPRAHYQLGVVYRDLGDLNASTRHLERFRQLQAALEADRRDLKERKAALKHNSKMP